MGLSCFTARPLPRRYGCDGTLVTDAGRERGLPASG